jgi:hypothetical protein
MTRSGVPFRLSVFWRYVVQLAHIILSRNSSTFCHRLPELQNPSRPQDFRYLIPIRDCGWLTALIAMGNLIALFKSVLPKLWVIIAEIA